MKLFKRLEEGESAKGTIFSLRYSKNKHNKAIYWSIQIYIYFAYITFGYASKQCNYYTGFNYQFYSKDGKRLILDKEILKIHIEYYTMILKNKLKRK